MTIPDKAQKGKTKYRFHSGPWKTFGRELIAMSQAIGLLEFNKPPIPHITRNLPDGRVLVYRHEVGFVEDGGLEI